MARADDWPAAGALAEAARHDAEQRFSLAAYAAGLVALLLPGTVQEPVARAAA